MAGNTTELGQRGRTRISRLAQNGTNLGLFKISFSTFRLGEIRLTPKSNKPETTRTGKNSE